MSEEKIEAAPEYVRRYVEKDDRIEVFKNHLVRLIFADGESAEALEPRRLFPSSFPSRYITLLSREGKEVAVIRDLAAVDPASREVIEQSLRDFYLIPHISRIIDVVEKYGTLHWTVQTDRGVKSFDIRNRNSDIRVLADGSVRVRDSDDNRYIIENVDALDRHSRMKMMGDL